MQRCDRVAYNRAIHFGRQAMIPCGAMHLKRTKTPVYRNVNLIFVAVAVITLALSMAAPHGVVSASVLSQEQPPHLFMGSATIDGNPAPEGTVVSALVNGATVGSVQVDAMGTYPALIVPTPGVTVTFEVGGFPAAESAITEVGGASILNLTSSTGTQGPTTPGVPQPVSTPNATAPSPTPVPTPTNTPRPPDPTPTPAATPVPPVFESVQSAFRVGPTVRLRPVNDMIDRDMDGIVELLFRNPVLNDAIMVVDLTISLPAGFHLYGEGFATDIAAGAASGSFEVPSGQSRTIFLNLKAEKTGRTIVHLSGAYWPKGTKDLFNPVSLTHPFCCQRTFA